MFIDFFSDQYFDLSKVGFRYYWGNNCLSLFIVFWNLNLVCYWYVYAPLRLHLLILLTNFYLFIDKFWFEGLFARVWEIFILRAAYVAPLKLKISRYAPQWANSEKKRQKNFFWISLKLVLAFNKCIHKNIFLT